MSSSILLIKETNEEKINQLIGRMSLEEKIGQLNQIHTLGEIDKEAIRNGKVGSILKAMSAFSGVGHSSSADAELCNSIQKIAVEESPNKIPLLFGRDVIHGYRTIFPIPLGQAASWNPELVEMAAAVAASEATADGIKWTFAPMVDITHDPRWGRVAEGYGEDPLLASRLAIASVRGYQGKDMAASHKMVACAKHFVGYGAAEGGRDYDSAEMSIRTLRDVYLPPFRAAVDAGVGTLMAAFHDLNGVPMSGNHELLSNVLRHEWGFKGFVVSDWTSIAELINHGVVTNGKEAAALGLIAGVDMEMVSQTYVENLVACVNDGWVSVETIDEAVRRILRIKFLAGLFEKPYTDPKRAASFILTPENRNAARLLAQQSIVLLKNDYEVLPLRDQFKKIAVVGSMIHATGELFGTWTLDGRSEDTISIVQAIEETHLPNIDFSFTEHEDEAIQMASRNDLLIAVLGEHPSRSGENSNVSNLSLPPGQAEFLKTLANQNVPVVLVVLAGRPLAIQKEIKQVAAVLYAWHPGIEGAHALVDVLFGAVSPSGKLPITIPRSTGQIPLYYNHKNSGRPAGTAEFTSRYVDLPHGPLFPFGYGMSYTDFEYTDLEIREPVMTGLQKISAKVSNKGSRPGIEIVQLYLRDIAASVSRPVKELKGFQRISLKPGETQRISFQLHPSDLSFTGLDMLPRLEPGDYHVWVGPSSVSGLHGTFKFEV